jgi:hypothetical protein
VTDQTERDAIRLLDPVRDMEPGPSSVDVHRAIRDGRRRVRHRRVASVAAAVVALAMVAVSAPSIADAIRDGRAHSGAAPTEFDPLRQEISVGSTSGFTPLTYETGRYRQRVRLGMESNLDGPDRAIVTVYPRGRLPSFWKPGGERAPDVNGHRAYWMNLNTSGQIAWEWAEGAWAFAVVNVREDVRNRAHRVAQSVSFAKTHTFVAPVRAPITMAPPDINDGDLQFFGTVSSYGEKGEVAGRLQFLLVFGGPEPERYDLGPGNFVLVGVRQAQAVEPTFGSGVGTIARPDIGGGFTAVAEAVSERIVNRIGKDRLTELADSVRLVPGSSDPQNWTTQPLR